MAIDTANKRASAPHHFAPMTLPQGSGSVTASNRAAVSYVYSGLPIGAIPATITNPFARQPFTLVKLTVPGDKTGQQEFFFSPKLGPPGEQLSIHFGIDIRPYLLGDPRGRPTKIQSDKALTERSRVTFNFAEDGDAPAFDDMIFSVTTGGEFWRRLRVAQPDYIGSAIEARRGFLPLQAATTFSDLELVFKGRLEEMDLQGNGSVSLIAKDELILFDRETPAQIGDDNLVAGVSDTGSAFAVTRGSEITDPASLPSRDQYPVVLRLESELIIVQSVIGNTVNIQRNHVASSEDFANTLKWILSSGTTVISNSDAGPFGGDKRADLLKFAAVADETHQISVLPATQNVVFSVWLRSTAAAGTVETITLELLTNPLDPLDVSANQVRLTTGWKRHEVSRLFTNVSPSVFAEARISRQAGDASQVLAFGASVEQASTRFFYAATTGTSVLGSGAGHGAFGTTAVTHGNVAFDEVIPYRSTLDPESGVHPVFVLRDLVNRGKVALANVDEDSFRNEFLFISSTEVKRAGTNIIEEPKRITEYVKEVREQSLLDLWMSEEGKARVRLSFRTVTPDESLPVFTDEDHIMRGGLSIRNNAESRITATIVYYDLKTDADGTAPSDFNKAQVVLDAGIQVLSGRRVKIIFGNWIRRRAEALALAGRTVVRFSRGARKSTVNLDLKDEGLFDVGSTVAINSVDILTREITGGAGSAIRFDSLWQVIQKDPQRRQGMVKMEGLESANLRLGFITPTTIADGGTFANDYDSADASERRFGFIGDSNNKVGASLDDGYHIL